MQKESNFISAVVYMHNCESRVKPFLKCLVDNLSKLFLKYEIILVNDACKDATVATVKETISHLQPIAPITLVNMSLHQGTELCMNAGLDISIGDFVYEFDTLELGYDESLILKAYTTALTGYDIVSVSPSKNSSITSNWFYGLFNSSINSRYKVRTDIFRLLSRRAINRVHAVSPTMPYRKAAYATSGLKLTNMIAEGFSASKQNMPRFSLAVDALAMYTNAAYKLSLGISGVMLFVTICELLYTFYFYFTGAEYLAEGWTTIMLVLSGGFFGVFLIFAIVIKYLSLIVELIFKQQKYLVEGIEKL